MSAWPRSPEELVALQEELGRSAPPLWRPPGSGADRARSAPLRRGPEPAHSGPPAADLAVGGCFVCFPRGPTGPGDAGDPAWAAAALFEGRRLAGTALAEGAAGFRYEPGLLALREGPLLEAAVRALPRHPDVLLVDATGRDHPRRAGLALHLGAVLDIPTVGVTHRPLVAEGPWPDAERGAVSELRIGDEVVGCWLRVRRGARPLAVHPGWRTDLESAVEVVLATARRARTPEPLRQARRVARAARGTLRA